MSGKHTAGPWIAVGFKNLTVNTASEGETIVACPGGSRCASLGELQANARLIASAPDLLAALEECADWIVRQSPADDWPGCYERAQNVIARAKGGVS